MCNMLGTVGLLLLVHEHEMTAVSAVSGMSSCWGLAVLRAQQSHRCAATSPAYHLLSQMLPARDIPEQVMISAHCTVPISHIPVQERAGVQRPPDYHKVYSSCAVHVHAQPASQPALFEHPLFEEDRVILRYVRIQQGHKAVVN